MRKLTLLSVLFLTTIFFLQAQFTLTDSLVAYYPFNGNANDESGNGHDGTINGDVVAASDRFGNANAAYTFDGVNDGIDVNTFTPGKSALTISAWVYPVPGDDYYKFIFCKQNPGVATNSNGDIDLYIDTTDAYGGVRTIYFCCIKSRSSLVSLQLLYLLFSRQPIFDY